MAKATTSQLFGLKKDEVNGKKTVCLSLLFLDMLSRQKSNMSLITFQLYQTPCFNLLWRGLAPVHALIDQNNRALIILNCQSLKLVLFKNMVVGHFFKFLVYDHNNSQRIIFLKKCKSSLLNTQNCLVKTNFTQPNFHYDSESLLKKPVVEILKIYEFLRLFC